tara:strand:+ start:328 stop:846 length:519 start_codon:yes stop_codon:yes gene_type:complete
MLKIKKIKIKKKLADEIEKLLTSNNFGWFYNPTTSYKEQTPDTFQFTHKFYDEVCNSASYYYEKALDLFQATNIKYEKFLRIKANFTVPSLKLGTKHQHIHTDIEEENISTFLYYVNDSDGDTIFYDGNKKEIKRFKPKKGTGIVFKSNILHAGSNPVKCDKRMIINFNFYE